MIFPDSNLLHVITCQFCGVRFGVDRLYYHSLKDGKGGVRSDDGEQEGRLCCPNGCEFTFKSTTADELLSAKHAIEQMEAKLAGKDVAVRMAKGKAHGLERKLAKAERELAGKAKGAKRAKLAIA